jgi:hypothetical protein
MLGKNHFFNVGPQRYIYIPLFLFSIHGILMQAQKQDQRKTWPSTKNCRGGCAGWGPTDILQDGRRRTVFKVQFF